MSNPFVDGAGWVVMDRLIADYLHVMVIVDGANVTYGTYLDPEFQPPAVLVERLPGGGIRDFSDLSRIQVTTYGRTRPESDSMTAQVRRWMTALSNDEWSGVSVDRVREDTGPGRIPDPDPELRAVPTTWAAAARQQ